MISRSTAGVAAASGVFGPRAARFASERELGSDDPSATLAATNAQVASMIVGGDPAGALTLLSAPRTAAAASATGHLGDLHRAIGVLLGSNLPGTAGKSGMGDVWGGTVAAPPSGTTSGFPGWGKVVGLPAPVGDWQPVTLQWTDRSGGCTVWVPSCATPPNLGDVIRLDGSECSLTPPSQRACDGRAVVYVRGGDSRTGKNTSGFWGTPSWTSGGGLTVPLSSIPSPPLVAGGAIEAGKTPIFVQPGQTIVINQPDGTSQTVTNGGSKPQIQWVPNNPGSRQPNGAVSSGTTVTYPGNESGKGVGGDPQPWVPANSGVGHVHAPVSTGPAADPGGFWNPSPRVTVPVQVALNPQTSTGTVTVPPSGTVLVNHPNGTTNIVSNPTSAPKTTSFPVGPGTVVTSPTHAVQQVPATPAPTSTVNVDQALPTGGTEVQAVGGGATSVTTSSLIQATAPVTTNKSPLAPGVIASLLTTYQPDQSTVVVSAPSPAPAPPQVVNTKSVALSNLVNQTASARAGTVLSYGLDPQSAATGLTATRSNLAQVAAKGIASSGTLKYGAAAIKAGVA